MDRILLYRDGDAVVLRDSKDLLEDFGRDFEEWPFDLDIYSQGNGLLIWEGSIDLEEEAWIGAFRRPSAEELRLIALGEYFSKR